MISTTSLKNQISSSKNGFSVILAWLLTAPLLSAAIGTFDSGNEGWGDQTIIRTTTGTTYETVSDPALQNAGWAQESNGNGYIRQIATNAQTPRSYSIGIYREYDPTGTLFGDLTGRTIQVDLMLLGDPYQTVAGTPPTLRLTLGDATVATSGYKEATSYTSKLAVSPKLNDLTWGTWTTVSFEISEENFFLWPHGKTGSEAADFDTLAAGDYNVLALTIYSSAEDDGEFGYSLPEYDLPDYGAYSTGTSTTLGIDNIRAVPEPSGVAMLGIFCLMIILRRNLKSL